MFGISYGELFLLIGATAALIGTKDLPIIARTAGRLAGRAVGYVQLARGQFDNIMQQTQARQVHKELQDTMAQLEAIRHEIRSISFVNPGPRTRRFVDNVDNGSMSDGSDPPKTPVEENGRNNVDEGKANAKARSDLSNIHSQSITYSRLAEQSLQSGMDNTSGVANLQDESGAPFVLPVSAESAGLLPNRKDDVSGSDVVLEALLEAEVAQKAKDFFSQPQNLTNP
ncbi:hypothetical protein MLD38_002485 [Melastoma candidum]|uniref:Uncharacterized protein n=1 Tax=Melastoma candidum TaxID=119954 RepID=A0ACB9RZ59_9MYRT|nr:hypothetical protein MLD38_002485 [Melastoma candidum]